MKDNNFLIEKISLETGTSLHDCYQCGKCTAGCPLNEWSDMPPSQVIRRLQYSDLSQDEKVLKSKMIWLCLSCGMCHSRCPMNIDTPQFMDVLRSEAMKRKMVHPDAKKILAFHNSFLKTIERNGRLHEAGLIVRYKLKTFALWQDVKNVPYMLKNGKLKILPGKIKGISDFRKAIALLKNKKEVL